MALLGGVRLGCVEQVLCGDLQLVTFRVVNVAGQLDLDLTRRCFDVVRERGIIRGPVDEVDQVEGELGRVGVDRVPGQAKRLALEERGVGSGRRKVDGRDEGRRKGEQGERAHLEVWGCERRRVCIGV